MLWEIWKNASRNYLRENVFVARSWISSSPHRNAFQPRKIVSKRSQLPLHTNGKKVLEILALSLIIVSQPTLFIFRHIINSISGEEAATSLEKNTKTLRCMNLKFWSLKMNLHNQLSNLFSFSKFSTARSTKISNELLCAKMADERWQFINESQSIFGFD